MKSLVTYRRAAPVIAWCAVLAAVVLVEGCGRKAAPPSSAPPGKVGGPPGGPNTSTNTVALAQTNAPVEEAFGFEDLLPPQGKDPFYPTSHRRDPVAPSVAEAPVHVDATLSLKAVLFARTTGQAVINNQIFDVGETNSVKVPDGSFVRVRCLEIHTNYVVVQVEGQAPKPLYMENKKKH